MSQSQRYICDAFRAGDCHAPCEMAKPHEDTWDPDMCDLVGRQVHDAVYDTAGEVCWEDGRMVLIHMSVPFPQLAGHKVRVVW